MVGEERQRAAVQNRQRARDWSHMVRALDSMPAASLIICALTPGLLPSVVAGTSFGRSSDITASHLLSPDPSNPSRWLSQVKNGRAAPAHRARAP